MDFLGCCVSALFLLCSAGSLCAEGGSTADGADKTHYLAEITDLCRKQWPNNRTINIVCHGHSVPAGYFKTPVVDTFNAYPHLLHRALKERFPHAVINVVVTAIGGESADSGAARFERDVLGLRPDIVTIDYALNDRRIGLDTAKAAWCSMIDRAKESGAKVILLTPTGDLSAAMDDPEDLLHQHARQIRALAAQHGVGLADSTDAFLQYVRDGGRLEELMSQVNHPNRKGHDLVVERLLRWFP